MEASDTGRLGVDVGGTFTDVVVVVDGDVTTAKVPTTTAQSDGVMHGIAIACENAGIDPSECGQFRHAMTVATNAMLEGTGGRTALVTTAGFADVIEIGRQHRPSLYDLSEDKPEPLVPAHRRYELDERAIPDGIEQRVSGSDLEALATQIDDDVESVAVSLLHAYAHPETEHTVTEKLSEELDAHVRGSHETLPEFREYERTATTVADAYVTPVMASYLDDLEAKADEQGVQSPRIMQSNGGIADAQTVTDNAVTTVLSGPAAGVVGANLFESGSHEGVITFDMGGTSCDVSLVRDGEIARTTAATVGGYPVHVPMVDVETVGAGGGSIAWVDAGGALRVGPRSAGAEPGPACYDRGGTDPTVTDGNLVLGYLGTETELGEGMTLDEAAAKQVVSELGERAGLTDDAETARGVYRVANATMSRTIRRVTLERGHDPREFALLAFGGAGPMHACALAERLGVQTVLVPKANGVLSALGLLAADERHDVSQTYRESLAEASLAAVSDRYEALLEKAQSELSEAARALDNSVTHRRQADMRYRGQSYELTIDIPESLSREELTERFHTAHERARGYRLDGESIEFVTLRVTVTVPGETPTLGHEGDRTEPTRMRKAYFDDAFQDTPVYDRTRLPVGTTIDGPAIFEGGESTAVLFSDWTATVDEQGTLRMEVDR